MPALHNVRRNSPDLADEFLHLGPSASLTSSTPSLETYRDKAYLRELFRRNEIQGGANTAELQRLSGSAAVLPDGPWDLRSIPVALDI